MEPRNVSTKKPYLGKYARKHVNILWTRRVTLLGSHVTNGYVWRSVEYIGWFHIMYSKR